MIFIAFPHPAIRPLTTGTDASGTGVFASGMPTGNAKIYASYNNGTSTTLNAGDAIQATGTGNILNLSDGATVAGGDLTSVAATVTGVQTLNVTSGEQVKVDATSANQGWTGLTTLTATAASNAAVDTITAAATTNVTVTDAAQAVTGGVTVKGGNNVTVSESGDAHTGNIHIGGASGNPAGAVVVTVTGSTGSTVVNVDGGTTAAVTTSQTGNVTVGANVAPSGAVTVTDTGGTGAVSVQGGASANITYSGATAGGITVTTGVKGATTIANTSVDSNAVMINGGTGSSVATSSGTVSAGATTPVAGNISVTNDSSLVGNSQVISVYDNGTASVTTTANAGTITVGLDVAGSSSDPTGAVTVVNQTAANTASPYGTGNIDVYTNGSSSVSITGGGTVVVKDDSAAGNTLTSVSMTGVGTSAGLTGKGITTITVNGETAAAVTTTVTNSTTGHTLTANVNGEGASGTSETIADNAATTMALVATGGANYITLSDSEAAAKLTYAITNNGTGTLTLGGITNSNPTGGIVMTVAGTGAVALGDLSSDTHLASITSTNTGGVVVKLNAANTSFNGGTTGNNVVELTSSTPAYNVNGGSGGSNTLLLDGTAATFATPLGVSLSNFQTMIANTTAATGAFNGSTFTNVGVGGITSTTAADTVTFNTLAAGTGLQVLSTGNTTASSVATAGTLAVADQLVINGQTYTFATNVGATEAASITALHIPGVTATGSGTGATGVVTITGAANVALGVTHVTTTIGTALGGVVTDTLAATPAAAAGNTLPITLNSAVGAAGVATVISEAGNQTITINSVADATVDDKGHHDANTIIIDDTSLAVNANSATSISVTGGANLTVSYGVDSVAGTVAASKVATIDASAATGKVDTTGIVGATTGLTIKGGSGALTADGSGVAAGEAAASFVNATDVITTGSGGGTISLGYAGVTSGSTTVNLGASTAKADTINVPASGTYGAKATISNFTASTTSSADVLHFAATEAILANVTSATATAGADTYTMSNGFITFTGADTLAQMKLDARALVDTGASNIAAFSDGTNTYVVASGSGAQDAAHDIILSLSGVTNVSGFAADAAGVGTVSGQSINVTSTLTQTNVTAASVADTASHTVNDAGYAVQGISGAGAGFTQTFNNLANSATILSTVTAGDYSLTTTQAGTAGTASLYLGTVNTQTIDALNITGDGNLQINAITAGTETITSLVDGGATNTLSTITVSGTQQVNINAITDTALTKITDSDIGVFDLGSSGAPITTAHLTVTTSAASAAANQIYLNGAGATIDASAVTTGSGTEVLSATGSGSTILGGIGATGEQLTVGANGTVTMLQGIAAAGSYAGAAGDNTANIITVGASSTVNLGTDANGNATDGGSSVIVAGDTTGATSSGSYAFVTVNNVVDNKTLIGFFSAAQGSAITVTGSNANTHGQINVASATSLGNAIDNAAANLGGTGVGGVTNATHYADWFSYGGNTYVLEHTGTGAAVSAMSAGDILVKITGVVDLSASFADATVNGHAHAGVLL